MPLQPSRLPVRALENVCWQCSHRLARLPARGVPRHYFSKTALPRASASISRPPSPLPSQRLKAEYFLSNSLLGRIHSTRDAVYPPSGGLAAEEVVRFDASTSSSSSSHPNAHLPHRRRQAERRLARAAGTAPDSNLSTQTTATPTESAASSPHPQSATDAQALEMPPDASSILAGVAARQPESSLRRQLSALLSLAKPRLTVLVVLTAMSSYALYPVPAFLSPTAALDAPSLSPLTLLFLTTGTTLCSAAANALNMLYEPRTDALMSRTRSRPLVRKLVSPATALLFAAVCALAGTAALYLGVNPTVAFLGAANVVIYAGIYTPLKRVSALNTWVGAVVGGIPPLMGWAAAAGETATAEDGGTWRALLFAPDGSSAGGWLLAGLLFAWQFPHFMALSWAVRTEYKAAGLRMLCWTNPGRNARVALRYSIVFVPLSVGLCAAGVTDWSFAVTSLPVNAWLIREAVRFWRFEGNKGSARGLFWASVWHLPVILVLALLSKKGMWGRVWRSIVGDPSDEDDEDDWEEDYDDGGVGVGNASGGTGE